MSRWTDRYQRMNDGRYIENFINFAARGYGKSQSMWSMFMKGLEEILEKNGPRSIIEKAEELSGMDFNDY